MSNPQIKPHYRIEIIEPKHVYLLGENSTEALTGEFYCQLVPLLDGQHSFEEICQTLAEIVDPEDVEYVLDRLRSKGYLTEATPELSPPAAAFWSLLNVEPQLAADFLEKITVYVASVGETTTDLLVESLTAVGIKTKHWEDYPLTSDRNALLVVLTDDYLQPQLAEINKTAIAANQPWLLAKPVGGLLWLGPIFEPEETGCWECLSQRLRGHREVEATVLRQKQKSVASTASKREVSGCLPPPAVFLPSTLATAINLITTEVAKWIVQQSGVEMPYFTTLAGKVITFNQANLTTETHFLSKRPQCQACGNPKLLQEISFSPLSLTSRKKHFTTDGGHRAFTPDQTTKRYEKLISPITGVVSALVRVSDPENSLIHTYSAIHSFGSAKSLGALRRSLRHKSGGKGKSDRQSKASGFCEAIERYSGIFQGDEARKKSTLAELGEQGIHPEKCLLFSPTQYANREELNANCKVAHDWIPQPFDASQKIEWTPVWSLTEQTHKYLPTAWCYYAYKLPKDHNFCVADSNGNAAGNTIEEAILQGFMELVERDSVAIWWYNRLQRPGVDLASFRDSYLLEVQEFYRQNQRELWVLDLTTDLGIPAFTAVSRRVDGEYERVITGFGAHFDPKIAILRAVTEVNQIGLGMDGQDISQMEEGMQEWMTTATLASHPYLAPNPEIRAKVYGDYPQLWSDDIYDDVLTCVKIAQAAGMETLVLDQTRPDIELKVVKVIVPGLRHFWSRFGKGRLYDVPVKMGLLSEALREEDMNSMPMVF
ncbi:MAG: TOMM precursor leader peptide-binding protein [Okeania sp. SIO3I5]|uniref:TOMM precursor leader peptide-binding protein n=1 Tax=Okeania sp. SIO3I5 TaxID=2607805 RepID=UPI0013B988DF|nr:TOMM precursor leader peptide-binding protein [Okeania sp. SIO3I5]NEQ40153.1 TOMM precursor leader peptide-binding protein [Okeania sp. SIO3I5]